MYIAIRGARPPGSCTVADPPCTAHVHNVMRVRRSRRCSTRCTAIILLLCCCVFRGETDHAPRSMLSKPRMRPVPCYRSRAIGSSDLIESCSKIKNCVKTTPQVPNLLQLPHGCSIHRGPAYLFSNAAAYRINSEGQTELPQCHIMHQCTLI